MRTSRREPFSPEEVGETLKAASKCAVDVVQELEDLLETYFTQVDNSFNRLQSLKEARQPSSLLGPVSCKDNGPPRAPSLVLSILKTPKTTSTLT